MTEDEKVKAATELFERATAMTDSDSFGKGMQDKVDKELIEALFGVTISNGSEQK